jgi:hypothetical protein
MRTEVKNEGDDGGDRWHEDGNGTKSRELTSLEVDAIPNIQNVSAYKD